MLEENSKLYFTKDEFERMGGEINLLEDEDEEIYLEFLWSTNVYFFIKNDDFIKMDNYIKECIVELNNIYLSLGMKMINL